MRLIEGVETSLMKNDLPVLSKHIARQISPAVGGKADVVIQKSVTYLFLAISAVDAVAASIVVGINLAG